MIPSPTVRRCGVALLVLGLATSVGAQFDPQHNHLVCYKIKGAPITRNLALFNQFSSNAIVQVLTPAELCVPTFKACCPPTTTGRPCQQQVPCSPDPSPNQPAPVDHFKCYKSQIKTCLNPPQCTKLGGFPKNIVVNLTDQFHAEPNLVVGAPNLLCTPVLKEVVGQTTTTTTPPTTTTTSTTTTTTTTTIRCTFSAATNGCIGGCPDPALQCVRTGPQTCNCLKEPVCCDCGPGTHCLEVNSGGCPTSCVAIANGTCSATTGQCQCGYCNDGGQACNGTPCSANQTCPGAPTVFCDPACGPATGPPPTGNGSCDPCASEQPPACGPAQCLKADGTVGQCQAGPTGCACQ